MLPDAALQGRSLDLELGPGDSVTYRVVLTLPALYQFEIQAHGVVPTVQLAGGGRTWTLDPGGTNDTQLLAGVYTIRVENPWPGFVQGQLVLRAAADLSELVLANGVGQGPALSLRLIVFPGAGIPAPGPAPMEPVPPSPMTPAPSPSSPAAIASALGPPTISFLGLASDLIGRPSPAALGESSSQPGAAMPQPAVPLLRAAAGGPAAGTPRGPEPGTDSEQPTVSGIVARDTPEPHETLPAGVGLDQRQVARLLGILGEWAVRIRTAASSWVRSWFGGPRSAASGRGVGTEPHGADRVSTRPAPGQAADREPAEGAGEPGWWAKLISWAIVAFSAGLMARMWRQFPGRRSARNRARVRGRRDKVTDPDAQGHESGLR
jgi:hypothetical protein